MAESQKNRDVILVTHDPWNVTVSDIGYAIVDLMEAIEPPPESSAWCLYETAGGWCLDTVQLPGIDP
jgi:hypothetical protein